MIRRLTVIIILALFCTTLYSQTTPIEFKVVPFGVSPRDVAKSTTDIYTYPSTGLHNVGVGSLMYFKASITGTNLGTVVWSITRRPQGSTAAVGTTIDQIDTNTIVVTFTPDKLGAYELTATAGAYITTVSFNAAKYLGYTNTYVNGVNQNVNCETCHSSYVAEWQQTGHAETLKEGVNGTASDHFNANCVSCHSTGYNVNAANDGFDDFTFTFPSVLTSTNYDELINQYPDAMKRANVQCEACHGPASSHVGVTSDNRMVATFNADVCASCHDSGTHHLLPEQFDASLHAQAVDESGPGRENCVRCHTGAGFKQYVDGVPVSDPYFDVSYSPITCAGCHDPHNATNVHQLRKVSAQLLAPNNTKMNIDEAIAGNGALCFNCHQSRSEANAAVAAATINFRFGPHHGPQGDMLASNNMLELAGVTLASSNHIGASVDACVRCHMYGVAQAIDATGNVVQVGGHSFSVKYPDGSSNMESCAQCHGGTLGASFEDVTFTFNGNGDHDNDGLIEGLQDEVKGMIEKIRAALPIKAGQTQPVPETAWTPDQRSAYWNMITAEEDKSFGIHNPKYIVTGLKGAMKLLGIPTDVESYDSVIPNDYTLFQNYPNPFNPSTNIKFSLPKASNVRLTIYDAIGREVRTLINNELNAGTHTIQWNASNLASGIYLYKIEAGDYVKVNKMLLLK